MINTKTILGATALFAGAVNGHMIMAQPQPFGKPDNSPLVAAGTDYPCKIGQTNGFMGSAIQMKSGSQQPLSFSGSAIHGGGSCQISLSKDTAPTPSSSFKVIHSFLGACPGLTAPQTFQFTIPSEVPNGKYTLAWTWFNNIGNREMYMNCAPVEVTGASASDSTFSSLPDMAIYNIASKNSCKTTETKDVKFPNPGKYVTTDSGFAGRSAPPVGSGCDTGSGSSSGSSSGGSSGSGSGAGTGAGSGAGSSGSSGSSGSFGEGASAGSSGSSATSSANNGQYTPQAGEGSGGSGSGAGAGAGSAGSAASSGAGSAATGSAGSGSGSGSGSAATGGAAGSAPTATSLLTVYSTATGSGSAATGAAGSGTSGAGNGTSSDGSGSSGSSSSSGSSGSSAGSSTPGGSCSPDGSVVCSADGTQYGLCNFGSVAMMPVAAGTKCSNGQIMRRWNFLS